MHKMSITQLQTKIQQLEKAHAAIDNYKREESYQEEEWKVREKLVLENATLRSQITDLSRSYRMLEEKLCTAQEELQVLLILPWKKSCE